MQFPVIDTDVLVIGAGGAGLRAAIEASAAGTKVAVITKSLLGKAHTVMAEGGMAAAMGNVDDRDNWRVHFADTMRGGQYLNDWRMAELHAREAPDRVRELEAMGVGFTRSGRGFSLGREGGHSHRRIVHATDFTGRAIEQVLLERVHGHPRVRVLENRLAVDLILESRLRGRRAARGGRDACWGAYVLDRRSGLVGAVRARCTVLATGGCGKVYLYTTNPDVATGDGLAMAYRAGVPVENLEFVQFHPTCLYHPKAKSFLMSEALRGEGAVLRALDGTRFMPRYHRSAELAPRDVVARAIDREMKRRGDPHVTLDISHRPPALVRERFPNICAELLRFGLDLTREPIPVVPAAHYMCGGVRASLGGRTSVAGLLAIGEVACTGLHGANRLASNSLLEALVGAHHAVAEVERRLRAAPRPLRVHPWSTRGTRPALETVQISVMGTVIAVLIGGPLGLLATSSLMWRGVLHERATRAARVGLGVLPYGVSRAILSVFRSIPEYVWAFMFVRAVGLGPFPGVLAIGVAYGGMTGGSEIWFYDGHKTSLSVEAPARVKISPVFSLMMSMAA